jgi:mono/diheme cytochrome c family protein
VWIAPADVADFSRLYAKNCSGCHGADGWGGASTDLRDPVYLAIADDATIRRITAQGVPGTAMPAFAQQAGGELTDAQIGILVSGMRSRWGKPGILAQANPPPYAAASPGDPKRGEAVFRGFCSSCHGVNGRGGQRAGSVVDGAYLALVSDQHLRTTVIVGLPSLHAPDWRSDVPGKPLSDAEVTDVVAWLASQRPARPGQLLSSEMKPPGGTQ